MQCASVCEFMKENSEHARTHSPKQGRTRACTRARTHARTHVNKTHADAHPFARTHTHTCTRMRTRTSTRKHTHTCTYARTQTDIDAPHRRSAANALTLTGRSRFSPPHSRMPSSKAPIWWKNVVLMANIVPTVTGQLPGCTCITMGGGAGGGRGGGGGGA